MSNTEDFAALLAEYEQQGGSTPKKKPRSAPALSVGQEVRGRVVAMSRDSVFVDLGGKDDGVLALDEVRAPDGTVTVQIGDEIQARVAEIEGRGGGVVLRRMFGRGAAQGSAELRQAFELGIPVEGHVSGVVKGGVEVQVSGARAFCPISQLEMRHVDDAAVYVGQRLQFKITRFEEGRSLNLVLSRRVILEAEAKVRAVELRKKLAIGAVLRGRVTAIKEYGAFVDLGGIEGMLHVSELSFQRSRRPSDVLTVGQELEVQIIKLEPSDDPRKSEKISLSLKSLERDPWSDIESRYAPGVKVQGTVMRTESFGAFIELEPGVEGLLHIGELGQSGGNQRLRHAKEAVKPGEKLELLVKTVDPEKRRLSLELASAQAARDEEAGTRAALVQHGQAHAQTKFGTLGDLLAKRKR